MEQKELSGEELYRLRIRKGISAAQAAKQVGVNRSTLYRYEQGEIRAPRTVREKLCSLYGEEADAYPPEEEVCEPPLTDEEFWQRYQRLSPKERRRLQLLL